ncbi:MAG: GGDEF domain-containing phosphodiesterase [Ruminococcus sp.]|nr:GGDEF domain-containing phosphodiesterase [Ruminococcus sp.]
MCNMLSEKFSDAMMRFAASSDRICLAGVSPESRKAVDDVCTLLGIAKLEIIYEIAARSNRLFMHNENFTVFSGDDPDESRPLTITKRHEDDSVFNFYICPKKGGNNWDDEHKSMITAFVTQIYLINDRARIASVAEKYSIMDNEMELFNLRYLMKTMGAMFASGEISERCACRFNISGLSVINSKLGRDNGTEIMKRFVYRLKNMLGEEGFISRLGGDNFITLFKKSRMAEVMNFLSGVIIPAGFCGMDEVLVSAHAGYYEVTDECRGPNEVMDALLAAEVASRSRHKKNFAVYDNDLKKKLEAKKKLESLFPEAIGKEEFLVYYQPKVNLKDYRISGAEALCRWRHEGELIQPVRFIPILEQSHNICILDFYVLEHVCRDMRRWIDSGMEMVKISVNLSRMHLGDERLSERIMDIIDRYKIPHEYIEIELTETTTDVNFRELKKVVASLHSLGISTSVDDFGVGYSSLNLIRDLPWNVLKIDKSFLPEEGDDNKEDKEIMLKYVISMAQELGLECIVEGVENMGQVTLLKDCSCFRAQGYYFDKPLPVDVFEERLTNENAYTAGGKN